MSTLKMIQRRWPIRLLQQENILILIKMQSRNCMSVPWLDHYIHVIDIFNATIENYKIKSYEKNARNKIEKHMKINLNLLCR